MVQAESNPSEQDGHPLLNQTLLVKEKEYKPLILSFSFFFFILAAYYSIRPIRDTLAVVGGTEYIQYLFTATFLCTIPIIPLYGFLLSRFPRNKLLPWVYLFFILNLVGFFFAFRIWPDNIWVGRVFFVWLSIFNLFVVTVFWSFMAEVYRPEQAKRLFGVIAAGGSIGAIVGPLLTRQLVSLVGVSTIPLIAALLLTGAAICLLMLIRYSGNYRSEQQIAADKAMGGSPLQGVKLMVTHRFLAKFALFMLLGTFLGSTLYFFQSKVIEANFDDTTEIVRVFASIDLLINLLAASVDLFLTARFIRWFGLGGPLAALPVMTAASFALLAIFPVFSLIVGAQVLRRVTLFAVTNPISHTLFTVVGPQSRYKFKHFLDTVVYRSGDTLGTWTFHGMLAIGLGYIAPAILGALLGVLWIIVVLSLVSDFSKMQKSGNQLP